MQGCIRELQIQNLDKLKKQVSFWSDEWPSDACREDVGYTMVDMDGV